MSGTCAGTWRTELAGLALTAPRAICGGMDGELSLIVNGETRRTAPGSSIADLVSSLGLDPAKVAVEHNGAIAPRSSLAKVMLGNGDVLEIVHFVGGG